MMKQAKPFDGHHMAFVETPMPEAPISPQPDAANNAGAKYVRGYVWVIVKNAVGYLLMLSALALGSVFPLPLGTPLFFIGFAMVNFPGKRRLTSRALRGIPFDLQTRKARLWRLAVSLILPPGVLWFLALKRHPVLHPSRMPILQLCGLYAAAIIAAWICTWLFLLGINLMVKHLPRLRRRVRPWLRRRGIYLLPPRRKRPAKAASL